jgi:hypothetical protein
MVELYLNLPARLHGMVLSQLSVGTLCLVPLQDQMSPSPFRSRTSSVWVQSASGVGLRPLYCGHFWPIVPAPDDK